MNQVNKRPNESRPLGTLDIISSLFPPCEATLILSIPLSRKLPPDYLIWHYDSKMLFSVKSACKVAISLRDLASPSNQSTIGTSTWNKHWRASIPWKVKICAWKACLNILPTRSNLEKKGVAMDNICVLCSSSSESMLHAFLLVQLPE